MDYVVKRKSSGKRPGRPKGFCEEEALMAAVLVFARKGFDGASLTELTKAMGINRFSMYDTYGNKEELYVRAMEAFNDGRKQRITKFLAENPAKEGVEGLLKECVGRFTDDAHGVCFVTQAPLDSKEASARTRKLMAQRRTEVEEAIRNRLVVAIEKGELPTTVSASDLARFYAVIIQGFALQAQHGGTREELLSAVTVAMSSWPQNSVLQN